MTARAASLHPRAALALLALLCVAFAAVIAIRDERTGLAEGRAQPAIYLAQSPAGSAAGDAKVAIETISSRISADPDVRAVEAQADPADPRVTALAVTLKPMSSGERRAALERIRTDLDPGTLNVELAGNDETLRLAEQESEEEAKRLLPFGLIVAPLAVLALVGSAAMLGTGLAAAFAVLGTIAIGSALQGPVDFHMAGFVPAAALAAALAFELSLRAFWDGSERAREITIAGLAAAGACGAAALIPVGYIRSAALLGAIAALLAIAGGIVGGAAARGLREEREPPRLADGWQALGSALAWKGQPAMMLGLLVSLMLAALALPLLDVTIVPLSVAELPGGASLPAFAAPLAAPPPDLVSVLTDKLAGAVLIACVVGGMLTALAGGPPGVSFAAPLALLPAAAAGGLTALVYGNGKFDTLLDYAPAHGLHLAAISAGLLCVAAISIARWVLVGSAAAHDGHGAGERARRALSQTGTASTLSSLVLAGAGAALLFSEVTFIEELGFVLLVSQLLDIAIGRALLAPAVIGAGR